MGRNDGGSAVGADEFVDVRGRGSALVDESVAASAGIDEKSDADSLDEKIDDVSDEKSGVDAEDASVAEMEVVAMLDPSEEPAGAW